MRFMWSYSHRNIEPADNKQSCSRLKESGKAIGWVMLCVNSRSAQCLLYFTLGGLSCSYLRVCSKASWHSIKQPWDRKDPIASLQRRTNERPFDKSADSIQKVAINKSGPSATPCGTPWTLALECVQRIDGVCGRIYEGEVSVMVIWSNWRGSDWRSNGKNVNIRLKQFRWKLAKSTSTFVSIDHNSLFVYN